jgi:hypothetical protein
MITTKGQKLLNDLKRDLKRKKFCLCKNKDDDTYHIFLCEEVYGTCRIKTPKCSRCREYELYNNDYECKFECKGINEARELIADIANNEVDICGNCVATLYKNLR